MQLTINERKQNPLLNRLEVRAELGFVGATPSNVKVQELVAKEYASDLQLVVVRTIKTIFSHQKAKVEAFVYKDATAKQNAEKKKKAKKEAKPKAKKGEK